MLEPILVGVGGAVGALLRYGVGRWIDSGRLPVTTFVVNVAGSFLLGLLTFVGVGDTAGLLVGVGLCGSFTTYSSFSVETVRLWETGDPLRAVLYAGATLVSCAAAVALAWAVTAVVA